MITIHENINIGNVITQDDVDKIDAQMLPDPHNPNMNSVLLMNSAFPEYGITLEQDLIIRKILNGKI